MSKSMSYQGRKNHQGPVAVLNQISDFCVNWTLKFSEPKVKFCFRLKIKEYYIKILLLCKHLCLQHMATKKGKEIF